MSYLRNRNSQHVFQQSLLMDTNCPWSRVKRNFSQILLIYVHMINAKSCLCVEWVRSKRLMLSTWSKAECLKNPCWQLVMVRMMSVWSLQHRSELASVVWKASKLLAPPTTQLVNSNSLRIFCSAMGGRPTAEMRIWFRSPSTRMYCMLSQSSRTELFQTSAQLICTICGSTSSTMWFLRSCQSFGTRYSTGSSKSRNSWLNPVCTLSVYMMFTLTSIHSGAGSATRYGKEHSSVQFPSLHSTQAWRKMVNRVDYH